MFIQRQYNRKNELKNDYLYETRIEQLLKSKLVKKIKKDKQKMAKM